MSETINIQFYLDLSAGFATERNTWRQHPISCPFAFSRSKISFSFGIFKQSISSLSQLEDFPFLWNLFLIDLIFQKLFFSISVRQCENPIANLLMENKLSYWSE